MIPTVGRIVHFMPGNIPSEDPQAAIITQVRPHTEFSEGQPPPDSEENKYRVSLHVYLQHNFDVGSLDLHQVPWSKESKDGHWSWPPRV